MGAANSSAHSPAPSGGEHHVEQTERRYSAIVLHGEDGVATLIAEGRQGDALQVIWPDGTCRSVRLAEDVPFGHKIAVRTIDKGQHIRKYGESIGVARCAIHLGQHVHVHNVESQRGRGDLAVHDEAAAT